MTPVDRYTHGHHESVLRSHRWRTAENSAGYLLAHLEPGQQVLDVGCGPGTITLDLARRVYPASVIGVDAASSVIEIARQAAVAEGSTTTTFVRGDVASLGFAGDSFDVVHAHQVLQHLVDPIAGLMEMGRVLRPGGLLAVRDSDYGAFAWSPSDERLTRWMELYHEVTRKNRADADAGRHLPGWVRRAGFSEISVSSSTWTFASAEDRQWWGGLWADRMRESDLAYQALEDGLSSPTELEGIAAAFLEWADDPEGLFVVPHVEVLARP
ncbi:MAG: methyltransferase domain-containing protein [Actinomycetes bacterium]